MEDQLPASLGHPGYPADLPGLTWSGSHRLSLSLAETILRQLPVGMMVLDPSGRCLLVNDEGEVLIQRTAGSRHAPPMLSAYHPDGRPCRSGELPHARALDRGERVERVELRMRRRDGVYVSTLASAFPCRNRHGRIEAVVAVFEDVTAAEGRWTRRADEQVEREREILAMASHDLRDPLQAISLWSATLLDGAPAASPIERGLTRIRSAASRATRLIRDFLDISQLRTNGRIPLELGAVDLHDLVDRACEEACARFPDRQIERERVGDARGQWDADRLTQVAINLITNSLKYGDPGRPVCVRTGCDHQSVWLSVHNHGQPIAPAELDRLFLPWHRAGRVAGKGPSGRGLGLFIVERLVRAHQGEIAVESTAEAGTTFTVRLPAPAPAPANG